MHRARRLRSDRAKVVGAFKEIIKGIESGEVDWGEWNSPEPWLQLIHFIENSDVSIPATLETPEADQAKILWCEITDLLDPALFPEEAYKIFASMRYFYDQNRDWVENFQPLPTTIAKSVRREERPYEQYTREDHLIYDYKTQEPDAKTKRAFAKLQKANNLPHDLSKARLALSHIYGPE